MNKQHVRFIKKADYKTEIIGAKDATIQLSTKFGIKQQTEKQMEIRQDNDRQKTKDSRNRTGKGRQSERQRQRGNRDYIHTGCNRWGNQHR